MADFQIPSMFDGNLEEGLRALASAALTYREVLFAIVGDTIEGKTDGEVSGNPAVQVLTEFEEALTVSEHVLEVWATELGMVEHDSAKPDAV